MLRRSFVAVAVGLSAVVLAGQIAGAQEAVGEAPVEGVQATFEGGTLNLAESWGEAAACIESSDGVECFRTDSELNTAMRRLNVAEPGVIGAGVADGGVVALASCSSSLRLYRSINWAGGTLVLTTRGVVHNLSTYGFDNDTSSYRVGACSSTFWAGSSGSGSVYPGPTNANSSANMMRPGWDNVVSSVYIN
jgi:hypothetical protein